MPAIQDVYSINVSNRFALAVDNEIDEGNESDNYGDFDPLDQLRLLEEQKRKDRLPKKKNKAQAQQEHEKSVPSKKEGQFKENKDANVPAKKRSTDTSSKKDEKQKPKKEFTSREFSGKSTKGNDKAPPGDENRRPRRQNNQRPERQPPRERGGEGDQFSRSYDDPSERPNKRGPMNAVGEGRMDRRDRGGSRYERYRGSRGGYRGPPSGFGYRNNYRSDGRDDRGKREFDRRSGSDKAGVRPSDKRDGGGARNWGTPGNEIEETVNNTTFENEDVGNWGDQPEIEEQGEEKQERPPAEGEEKKEDDVPAEVEEVEEDNTPTEMTLDEWRAMQNAASKKKQFNIRKAGEGEESGKWSNMEVIHGSTVNKPIQHHVVTDDNLRSSTAKPTFDVNIRFDMPPRTGRGGGRGGRGFRGSRGGYRGSQRGGGGGGRYGNRYGNQHPPPPDVLNEKEFPTLPAA